MVSLLDDADRDAIAQAVTVAEAATSGEIVCVLARRVSTYPEIPLAWAAGAALLIPPLAMLLGLDAGALTGGGWRAAHGPPLSPAQLLGIYATAQALLFGLVFLLVSIPSVRRCLTPGRVKARRVRSAALAQLAAATLAAGPSRAAVVIFAAEEEHRVEVLASEAAHARIGQGAWDAAVAAVLAGMRSGDPTTGFVRATALCGAALAEHFPQDRPDDNAISNRPLEL